MQMIGLARLGRAAELRTIPSGESVCNLSLAFNYGRKDQQTGERPTQWIDGSLWGKQAEALEQYLTKGKLVCVTLEDVHIEEYQGQNGPGHKLAAKVTKIELAGGRDDAGGQNAAPAQRQPAAAPQPARQAPAPRPASGFDDDDSDVPF